MDLFGWLVVMFFIAAYLFFIYDENDGWGDKE